MKSKMRQNGGFTLIELIIVTTLVSIMAAALAPIVLSTLHAYDSTLGDTLVLDKLRYSTERLAREIRGVQYASSTTSPATNCGDSPSTTDHYCISAMSSNNFAFRRAYTDTTGGVTWRTVTIATTASCSTGVCVTLAYSDMNSTGVQVLTDELGATSNLALSYYQQDGTTTANIAGNTNCTVSNTCVRYVEISLTLRHNNNNYTQRTRVELRNPPLS